MAIVTRTQRRFSWTAVLILAMAGMLAIPAMADHGDPNDPLTLHQQGALGLTAAQVVEQGLASNDPDGCGDIDLEAGEVGWAFLTPGNHRSNFFTHFIAGFSSGDQVWAFDSNPGDATRVRVQGGNTTLVAFASGFNDTLVAAEAWGIQDDGRFNLTHVCVGEEPPTFSILIEKTYEVEPLEGESAVFTINPGDITMTEHPGDLYCTDGLPAGTYTISETAPTGFLPVDDFPVTPTDERDCDERIASANPDPDETIENLAGPVDLNVTKFKLSFADGDFVPTLLGLSGFKFTLYEGGVDADGDPVGAVIATSTTDANGETNFADGILEVGEQYTVCETDVPVGQAAHWTEAEACETFTTELNEDVTLSFYNAPRADIQIGFVDVTTFTSVNIVCIDVENDIEVLNESWTSSDSATIPALDLGDYSCDIEIRNGEVNDD